MHNHRKGIEQGSDYIECDAQVTKDLQLICNHDPWISEIVGEETLQQNTEYLKRKKFQSVVYEDPYGNDTYLTMNITDWFVLDFTADELKNMTRVQQFSYRDPNYDNEEAFCTFQEYIDIAKAHDVGIYPELKYPHFTNSILKARNVSVTTEDLFVDTLQNNGYASNQSKCFVQSFEKESLEILKAKIDVKQIYLLWEDSTPSCTNEEKKMQNKEMWERALRWAIDNDIAGIGLDKRFIITKDTNNSINSKDASMIEDAHLHGLQLHIYTFAHDHPTFAWDYGKDPAMEYTDFINFEIDGFFSDFPAITHRYLQLPNYCEDKNDGGHICNNAIRQVINYAALLFLVSLVLLL